MQLDSANFSESNGRLVMGFSIGSQETREKKKKKEIKINKTLNLLLEIENEIKIVLQKK